MGGIDEEIGRRVRSLRRTRGLTLQQVAGELGIPHEEVRGHEAGSERIPAGRLSEFARLFGVPISLFFENVELEPAQRRQVYSLLDDRALELARCFDALSEAQKRAVMSLVRSLSFMQAAWDEPVTSRRRDGS